MKYAYDFEFIENGPDSPIRPLSLGMVCEDGRTLYRETPYSLDTKMANDWVIQNVYPGLTHYNKRCKCPPYATDTFFNGGSEPTHDPDCPLVPLAQLKEDIMNFFLPNESIELIGYYSSYDHVVLCQIFGRMIDLPKGIPYFTLDLKQYAYHKNVRKKKDLPKHEGKEHNALDDAKWIMRGWMFVEGLDKVCI